MRNVHTNFKHCLCDILLRHSMLQLCSVVIFDNFVVLVSRFYSRALVSLIPVGGYILYHGMTERYWVAGG